MRLGVFLLLVGLSLPFDSMAVDTLPLTHESEIPCSVSENNTVPLHDDYSAPLNKIVENTQPLDIKHINLLWWSFGIAILSLFAGTVAAIYSYGGFKYQRISAAHLEAIVPGHMSYYEIVGSLLSNILCIEALFFGRKNYKEYPIKLFLSTAKLPYDLIHIEKYEKDKKCYNEAFKLSIAWQNYNNYIDLLIDYSENDTDSKKVASLAQFIIDLTKTEIILVQNFEGFLFEKEYIQEKTATNEQISWFLINRFLESINYFSSHDINGIDTSRTNLTIETKNNYINCSYLPLNFDKAKYLQYEHNNQLSDLGGIYSSFYSYDPHQIMDDIVSGKYNKLGTFMVLPKGKTFADIDFSDFQSCYFNYIEPLLIGYKRHEFSCCFE